MLHGYRVVRVYVWGEGVVRRGARLCAPGSGMHLLQCDGEPYWLQAARVLCCVIFVIRQPPTELCWQAGTQQHQSNWFCPFGHHLARRWRQAWQAGAGRDAGGHPTLPRYSITYSVLGDWGMACGPAGWGMACGPAGCR